MGQDRGSGGGGFDDNFAYFTLALSNGTRLKLVDASDNFSGPGGEFQKPAVRTLQYD